MDEKRQDEGHWGPEDEVRAHLRALKASGVRVGLVFHNYGMTEERAVALLADAGMAPRAAEMLTDARLAVALEATELQVADMVADALDAARRAEEGQAAGRLQASLVPITELANFFNWSESQVVDKVVRLAEHLGWPEAQAADLVVALAAGVATVAGPAHDREEHFHQLTDRITGRVPFA
jgi:hypothetical protein